MKTQTQILSFSGAQKSSSNSKTGTLAKTISLTKEIRTSNSDNVFTSENISIFAKGKIEVIALKEICFIKAESNYVRILMENGQIHMIAKTLKAVALKLIPKGFLRVHHSYLVHPRHIQQYNFQEATLRLRSQQEIPVSRSCRKMVTHLLSDLAI